jgi:hypothetical protein
MDEVVNYPRNRKDWPWQADWEAELEEIRLSAKEKSPARRLQLVEDWAGFLAWFAPMSNPHKDLRPPAALQMAEAAVKQIIAEL